MRRDFYRKNNLTVDRQQLLDWAEQGVIYDIARPQNIYIDGWIVMPLTDLSSN